MNRKTVTALICLAILLPHLCQASGVVRRFVLAAGANSGGPERVPLLYAVSDAEKFAEVLTDMGGVNPRDRVVLENPDLRAFEGALEDLSASVSAAGSDSGRTEVLLYYSGHADEDGLLLGGERFSYSSLRHMVDSIDADVRITVLDACASGAITRLKGGERRQAFLVDDSSDMEGYAFLTSSSADEAAQESDMVGASFFTHYLVSGMRGAADVSGEGKVTLNEAYQFAFHETLERTTETQAGAQHPSYHINMSGTGDVVMTDVRQTSVSLLLADELDGRFFVRNADRQLVAELYKPAGRSIELGLEPGYYEIILERTEEILVGSAELATGDRLVLSYDNLEPGEREPAVARGAPRGTSEAGPALYTLNGRSRVELIVGWWSARPNNLDLTEGGVTTSVNTLNILGGLGFAHWLREDLAVTLDLTGLGSEFETVTTGGVVTQNLGLVSIMVGARKYLPASTLVSGIRPFLSASAGTFIGGVSQTSVGVGVDTSTNAMGAFGGRFGGGVDMLMGRYVMLSTKVAYNLMSDFSRSVGGRDNYSGFEVSVGVGLVFHGFRPGA
jgi:hypothetical protein